MRADHSLLPDVVQTVRQQPTGDPLPLIFGRDGKVVDLERPAVVEQHRGAEDEAGDLTAHNIFQPVCLLGIEQLAHMDHGVLRFPRIVPRLA